MYFISPARPAAIHAGNDLSSGASPTGAIPDRSNPTSAALCFTTATRSGLRYAFGMRTQWFKWGQPLSGVQSQRVSLIVACLLAAGNLVAQQPVPSASQTSDLVLTATSHEPMRLSATELKALPHIAVTF